MKIIWFFLALLCIVGCSNYEKVQRKYLVKYNEYIYEIYSDSYDNALYYVIRGEGTPIFDVDFQPTITKFSIREYGPQMKKRPVKLLLKRQGSKLVVAY